MKNNFDLALLPERAFSFFERPPEDLYRGFTHVLPANLFVDDNEYTIEVGVPGLSRKNISIVVEDSQLVVTANREDRKRREDETEFKTTFLRRSFPLPDDVVERSISASCRHGLLRISMKRKRREGRRIPVGEAKTVRPLRLWNGLTKQLKNFGRKIGLVNDQPFLCHH